MYPARDDSIAEMRVRELHDNGCSVLVFDISTGVHASGALGKSAPIHNLQ